LVESQEDSGFRNITVLVDAADSVDEICMGYGIMRGDYDFVIVDNLGTSECDACIILASTYVTPEFDDEIELLISDDSIPTVLLQFGGTNGKERVRREAEVAVEVEEAENPDETPRERRMRLKKEKEERAKADREERKRKQEEGRQKRQKGKQGEIPEDYDPAEKFRILTAGKSLRVKKSVQLPFPTLQEFEKLEAEHMFSDVNSKLADVFYDLLKGELAVAKIDFQKEVRRKDEGGGNLRSRQSVR